MAADRQAVAELSISNATLTHELRKATATIATLQQRLASCECAQTPRTGKKVQKQHQKNPHRELRHWIQMDIAGHIVITSVGATTEHRVTIPFQDIRVQPPERIRWEEATRTNRNDIQGRTYTTWISNISIWLKTETNRSILIPCVMIPP